MKNMIIPIGKTTDSLPIEFQYNKDGWMYCIDALDGIDLNSFDCIYFVFNSISEAKWSIREQLNIQVNRLRQVNKLNTNVKTRLIEIEPTTSQAETIYKTIIQCNIKGSIFIKDSDNKCELNVVPTCNSVCVYSLEDCDIVDPKHKSYVIIDDNMFVTNIIEKKVVSNYFNCGGYSFENVDDFIDAYKYCHKFENTHHVYLSHIIYYLILFQKKIFKPTIASNYFDFVVEQ